MNTDKSQTNPKSKAVFLDRDGTICEDVNYLSRAKDLRIFPFVAEAIKLLNNNNFLVILITNQSGIARGYFDENTLCEIHEKLVSELALQGAALDQIYFCPHNTDDNCKCRKPKIGMIEQATEDFAIDLEKSWTIGDKAIDVELGFNAGTKTTLVLTGYGRKEIEKMKRKPNLITQNLLEAVGEIMNYEET
jgi:histidinol-phosphate phosphatase family protein